MWMDVFGESDYEFMVKEVINIYNIKHMKQLDLLILEKQDTEQERESNYTLPHGTILKVFIIIIM